MLDALKRQARPLLWTAFILGFTTAFWQYFEFAYTLYERGAMASPLWSGTVGWPMPHHGYVGFIMAGISITVMELKRRHDRGAKDGTDR